MIRRRSNIKLFRFIVMLLIVCYGIHCLTACEKIQADTDTHDERNDNTFTIKRLFSFSDFGISACKGRSQGMDIYDNRLLFQAGLHKNTIYVLNLNTQKFLGSISFSVPHGESSHMNNINCGEKFSRTDVYPLLYVSQTSDSHSCFVIRLSNDLASYDLIQTIKYIGTKHHTDSNYDWFIDLRNQFVYTYGKHDGILEDREIVKFKLPSGEISEVVFTDHDVIDSFILKKMSIYQGSRIINGLLYAPVGYGNSNYPGYLKIIDLDKKNVVKDISITCGEPESIGQYKDGAIICGGGDNPGYYFIQFKSKE